MSCGTGSLRPSRASVPPGRVGPARFGLPHQTIAHPAGIGAGPNAVGRSSGISRRLVRSAPAGSTRATAEDTTAAVPGGSASEEPFSGMVAEQLGVAHVEGEHRRPPW